MNSTMTSHLEARQDTYARQLARHLERLSDDLPYDITERLRAARMQAVAQRKVVTRLKTQLASQELHMGGGTAALGFGEEGLNLWSRLASALPLLVLVAGLILIHVFQNDQRARELADVDAALLTDDLPPAAYADPGFLQYIKISHDQSR
jgi:Protein of unknown function (DUF3619)